MPSGGYRAPAQPAPVSGPGALSRRTDGKQPQMQLADARYGEQQAFQQAQSAGAMPQVMPPSGGGGGDAGLSGQGAIPMSSPVPLTQGTVRPGEPVTTGAPSGAGPNQVQGLVDQGPQLRNVATQLATLAAASGGNPDLQYLAGLAQGGRL